MYNPIDTANWLNLQFSVSVTDAKKKAYIQVIHSLPSTTINCFIG